MTDLDRDKMRMEDHTAIGQILAIARAMVERANLHDHRLSILDEKVERERQRGEMRDRELVAIGRKVDNVEAATSRIETNTSTIVEQLRLKDATLDSKIDAEAKRPRQWLGVTFDGSVAKWIGGALVGALMLLGARYGWTLPAWMTGTGEP